LVKQSKPKVCSNNLNKQAVSSENPLARHLQHLELNSIIHSNLLVLLVKHQPLDKRRRRVFLVVYSA